ncbi:MAG: DNA (cytosine-5-)-methyltransferase [Chloroflexi bacterium]|nr:DNA (cytosine-5-)-methyltransferase [Chloroflexota bacterium]
MVGTITHPPPIPYSEQNPPRLRAVELFAGVGGFRLGLREAGWSVVWSNQWEPSTKSQHASDCYVAHFGADGHSNEDISQVVDRAQQGECVVPEHDLLVGGFPCQDYSVARTLNQAAGLVGKKGVLWWEIYRLLRLRQPRFIFLENVDRLLKSPANQRGRDFAVMLACLAELGYTVEWRVVNAADYGFPQRRRRVFIVGEHTASRITEPMVTLESEGILAAALPASGCRSLMTDASPDSFELARKLDMVSATFGLGIKVSRFRNAGLMQGLQVWTTDLQPAYPGERQTLGDILQDDEDVDPSFFISEEVVETWRYLKGAKAEPRTHSSGFTYNWSEGAIAFPDPLDKPSRTVLTGEGGSGPSRFKHVIGTKSGRLRRLTPVELERLNGFPDDWTAGVPDNRRAFLMGNALVVGLIERIAQSIAERAALAHYRPPRLLEPTVVGVE